MAMATKRRGNINITVPRAELDNALGDGEELTPLTQEEEDYEDFLNSGGPGTSWVEFYRLEKDGNFWNYDKQPYSIIKGQGLDDYIRTEHGPGKWQVVLKDAKRKWLTSKIFYIGGKSPAPASQAAQANGKDDSHLQFMREQLAAQQTMMIAMLGAMKGPDMGSMLQAFAAMMPKNDLGAMFSAVVTAINSFKPQQEDKLQDLKNLAGVLSDLRGSEGEKKDENSWPALIRDGLGMIAGGAAAAQPAAQVVQARPAIPPGAQPVELIPANGGAPGQPVSRVTTAGPTMPAAPQTKTEIEILREAIAGLKQSAREGASAEAAAKHVAGCWQATDAAICRAMDQGATIEMLCMFDPEIGSDTMLTAWFTTLYEKLTNELYVDPEAGGSVLSTVDSGGPRGNGNHALHDASGSPSGQSESGGSESSSGVVITTGR